VTFLKYGVVQEMRTKVKPFIHLYKQT